MIKKVVLTIAAILVIGLVGCNSSTDNGEESASDSNNAYPEKSIDLIVPFGAGGGTDQIARLVATALEDEIGEPVVVTNKPSASGVVGSNEIASADADGYTLGVFSNTDVANFVYAVKTGVNFGVEDFTYLGGLNETGDLLVVPKNSEINSLDEFVKAAEDNPGKITVALPSKTQEMNITSMENEIGIDITSVVYESGNKVLADLIGGHTESGILSAQFAEQAEDQGLKVLGVMLEERLESIDNIPTFTEQGYEVVNPAARLLVGPADLPENVAEAIESALTNAYGGDLSEGLTKMGEVPKYKNMEELSTFLEKDFEMRESILSTE